MVGFCSTMANWTSRGAKPSAKTSIVDARQKNSPELAFFRCLEPNITATDLHRSSLNGCKILVLDKAFHPPVGLAKEPQQGFAIVLPETLELSGRRELAAGKLESDLHAPVPDVVVVLHASCQWIPRCPICCPVLKL